MFRLTPIQTAPRTALSPWQHNSIAAFSDGGLVLAWDTGLVHQFQLVSPEGLFQNSGEIRPGGRSAVPNIAVLPDDRFVISYTAGQGFDDDSTSGFQMFDRDGTSLSDPIPIFLGASTPTLALIIQSTDNGEIAVAATGYGYDGSEGAAILGRFDTAGNALSPVAIANQSTDRQQSAYDLEITENGQIIIAWSSETVLLRQQSSFIRIFDADETAVTDQIQLNQYIVSDQGRPSIAILSDGRIIATWESAFQDRSEKGIYARLFSADGVALTDEFRVNQQTLGDQTRPDVLAMPDGGFTIAWTNWETGNIHARSYDTDGTPLADEVALTDAEGYEFQQELVGLGGNRFGMVWTASTDMLGFATFSTNQPTTENDLINGTRGGDVIAALAGDDLVSGLKGADDLNGQDGADTLRGGVDADTLTGGNGDDNLLGQRHGDLMFGGNGRDTLKGGGGNDTLSGGAENDFLKGGTRRDSILGGDGDDRLLGNAHNDTLRGGSGNDLLIAGGENDLLDGGAGDDTLRGGDGADVFIFYPDAGNDIIQDFDVLSDSLQFHIPDPGQADYTLLSAQEHQDGLVLTLTEGGTILLQGVTDAEALNIVVDYL
jgi:Ca2+-binding RTX toxin-like protein